MAMADFVHFKFDHEGSWHRFALPTRGRKLFPRLKKRIHYILGVTEQELFWDDGETINCLNDSVDLHAAIVFAEHHGKICALVPCVYIHFTPGKRMEEPVIDAQAQFPYWMPDARTTTDQDSTTAQAPARRIHVSVDDEGHSQWREEDPYRPNTDQAYAESTAPPSAPTYGYPTQQEGADSSPTWHQEYAGPDEALLSLMPELARCSHPLNVSLNTDMEPLMAVEGRSEALDRPACHLSPSQCKVTCPDRDRHIAEALQWEAEQKLLQEQLAESRNRVAEWTPMAEEAHVPTAAETLEYGPAIFALHNEIAASKERIALAEDRFEKKREAQNLIQHKMQLYKERKHLILTNVNLREEVRLAAEYFRSFIVHEDDVIDEMQRLRHLEFVKGGIYGKIPFEHFPLSDAQQRKSVQYALPFLRVAIDAGIEKIEGLSSRIADRVAFKAKRNSGDHASDSSGSWESALEELHQPKAKASLKPLPGPIADVSSCYSALSNMEQHDANIAHDRKAASDCVGQNSALPNPEKVVEMADLTSPQTMEQGGGPPDMDELKRRIKEGQHKPPAYTTPRSANGLNLKNLSSYQAALRAEGVRSSHYPDDHQIAEQEEADRLADQFAALPDAGVNTKMVKLEEDVDVDREELSISTTPPPLVEQVVTSMLDAKRSSIATVLNKQFGGDREGLAVHPLICQEEPSIAPSAPPAKLMDDSAAVGGSAYEPESDASLQTIVMPSPPQLISISGGFPTTLERHQERLAELERKKAMLRQMRLAKERAYGANKKDEQSREQHRAILSSSLAYTAYPDGIYDVMRRPSTVAVNDEAMAKEEAPTAIESEVSPTKVPVETSLKRFTADYRANELQRRKAKAAEMRRARKNEKEQKQQHREREIWMRAEQSRLAGERFLDDLRNLLIGLNSVTAEAATEEFLYTARSFVSSPKLNAVVALIFDMAVERPECAELYARLCAAQVLQEAESSGDEEGPFYQAVFSRAHDILHMRWRAIAAQQQTHTNPDQLRTRMYGYLMFTGHLFMHDVLPPGFILLAAVQLLQSVVDPNEQTLVDNDSIECAVRLLLLCGDRLDAMADDEQRASTISMPMLMTTLEHAVPYVNERVRAMIVEMANANAEWAQPLAPVGGVQAGGAVAGGGESMLDVVADLLYANSASTVDDTARQLFALNVHETPLLKEVVALIFDKAADQPSMHEYDAALSAALIAMEVSQGTISKYRCTIIDFIKDAMAPTDLDRLIKKKEKELAEELDGNMKGHLQMELIDMRAQGNRKKLVKFTFFSEICLLDQCAPMRDLLEAAILHLLRTLLASHIDNDDEAIECAVSMLDRAGKMLEADGVTRKEIDRVFRALEALPHDNGMRLGNKIGRLLSTRRNGWVPQHADTASYDVGVREIHREQLSMEHREQKEQADRQDKLFTDLGKILDDVDSDHVGQCIDHFLDLRVHNHPTCLKRIVSIIFEHAVNTPARAELYASICAAQVQHEPEMSASNHNRFQHALIDHAKWLVCLAWRAPDVADRELEILTETDEEKRLNLQIQLIEITCKERKKKFDVIEFLGRLFMLELIPSRIIDEALKQLLKTMESRDEVVDEESIKCALQLLQQCGQRLHQETLNGRHPPCFNILRHFDTLTVGMGRVSKEISDQIKYLNALRANNWSEVAVERHIVDDLMVEEARVLAMPNNVEEDEDEDEAFQDDADWLYDSASEHDEDADLTVEEAQEAAIAEMWREDAEAEALLAAKKADIIEEEDEEAEEQDTDETKKERESATPAPQSADPNPQPSSDDEKGRSSTSSWSKVDSTDSDV